MRSAAAACCAWCASSWMDRWWPMKPFTPRISTFFIFISSTIKFKFPRAVLRRELCRVQLDSIQLEAHHAQHAAAADRISLAFFHVEDRLFLACHCALGHQRLQDAHRFAH